MIRRISNPFERIILFHSPEKQNHLSVYLERNSTTGETRRHFSSRSTNKYRATVKNRIKSRVCVDRVCKLAPLAATLSRSVNRGSRPSSAVSVCSTEPERNIRTLEIFRRPIPPFPRRVSFLLFFLLFSSPDPVPRREQCREIRRRINRFLRDITFIPSALARLHPLPPSQPLIYTPRPHHDWPPFGESLSTVAASLEA